MQYDVDWKNAEKSLFTVRDDVVEDNAVGSRCRGARKEKCERERREAEIFGGDRSQRGHILRVCLTGFLPGFPCRSKDERGPVSPREIGSAELSTDGI